MQYDPTSKRLLFAAIAALAALALFASAANSQEIGVSTGASARPGAASAHPKAAWALEARTGDIAVTSAARPNGLSGDDVGPLDELAVTYSPRLGPLYLRAGVYGARHWIPHTADDPKRWEFGGAYGVGLRVPVGGLRADLRYMRLAGVPGNDHRVEVLLGQDWGDGGTSALRAAGLVGGFVGGLYLFHFIM